MAKQARCPWVLWCKFCQSLLQPVDFWAEPDFRLCSCVLAEPFPAHPRCSGLKEINEPSGVRRAGSLSQPGLLCLSLKHICGHVLSDQWQQGCFHEITLFWDVRPGFSVVDMRDMGWVKAEKQKQRCIFCPQGLFLSPFW